jgi:ATP-dependent Clp protease ATP-binding subunit ClpA
MILIQVLIKVFIRRGIRVRIFLNRIDDVVVFNSLVKEDIFKIIYIELESLYKRVNDLGYKLN